MSSPPATPTPENRTRREEIADAVRDAGRRRIALYVVLFGLVGFYLAPLEAGLMTAFKTTDAFNRTVPFVPPIFGGFTLEPWRVAFNEMSHALINSMLLAVPATILSAGLGSIAAYGLTTIDWKYQMPIVALFVAGIFIPYQAVLVPLSRLFAIVNTQELLSFLWGLPLMHEHYASIINLIITHVAYGIPITFLLFRGYYQNLSVEMIEAAKLDGASVFSIYRNIVLPLSTSMFAVTLIYQFTQIWNDLLFALVILPSGGGAAAPVTVALNSLTGGIIQSFNTQMAGAFVAALPTLLVYVLFGEQFAEGVAGS
ncbi:MULTISPECIES: carbohydrate ABC transporter permease [Halorussus]|uniref:carbohydrate ABC transporter permease n=1 Tax=Halorussus TaxID=1070314 RepID=UPI000E212EE0|nr:MULTISPECIES: carbohydrate ABC transporter permease [Halorussus]NHN58451.1 carbohydrate ABC transporter permease [Halorussus sp. JP-T4]